LCLNGKDIKCELVDASTRPILKSPFLEKEYNDLR
jgi:hypothetical protein